ncbi:hypothetical protein [Sutcliffiella halmapala]|uniref:hypothetical protein n=1 Tax=Sutcliffiella halmapala TaxID=79882 RepID=UPI000995BCD5|nr:hypothetical protein [Sutcliffiella halmapala]
MHPVEIIELMFVGAVLITIIAVSFFLKGKWRKVGWTVAIVILIAYSIFYVVRPHWIDVQISEKVDLLVPYLKQRYPGEEWVISTVPHRLPGHKSKNPYYIGVIFESEPDVTYEYWIENKNNIFQISFATNKSFADLEHMEIEWDSE